MSNLVTVNSGSAVNGSLKAGRVSISTDSSIIPTSGGKTWYNMINPAEGYVFITDNKIQAYGDGVPLIYPTQTSLPADILATVNGLPDRVGSVPFDNVWDALVWVQSTGKYFILNKTLSGTVTDNIIFAVDFSQPSSYPQSGSTAFDLSGNDNNGTLGSGIGFNSKGWVNFNGTQTSNYNIAVPINRAELGNNMSIEATFKYEGASGDGYRPIIGGNDPGAGTEIFFGKNTGNTNFGVQDGNYAGSFVTNYNVFDGEWHHMVYTYDNGTGKIYLDGVLRNSGAFTKANNAEQIYIGAEVQEGYWWNGDISQVKYYTKTLSSPEILQNYYGAPIITDNISGSYQAGNLVSYTPGNGDTYNMAANIISGSLQNGVEYKPDFGGYWKFDGVNDRILFEGSTQNAWILNSSPSWTVNAWVRTPNGSFGSTVNGGYYYGPILSNTNGGPIYSTFQINGGTIAYTHYNGSWLTKYGTTVVNDGNWHLLTWVNSSNSINFYVDGKFDGTGASNISGVGWLDAIGQATSGYFIGDIASLQINQGKAFTASEVSQQYFAEYPRFKSSRDVTKGGVVLELDAANPNSYLSGTTWTDLSGKGNNITLNNGPTYSTANGGTINFDGSDDSGYKNTPSGMNFSSTNAMSAEAWIKYSPNAYDFWFTGNNSGIRYRFGTNSSRYFYWDMGQHVDRNYTGYQVPQNEWVHVVFTGGIESGRIITRVYANGALITTQDEGISSLPNVGEIWVGHGEGQGTHPFNGDIALLKIYNRVLTPQEILSNYTTSAPRYRVQLPRSTTDSLALDVDFGNTTSYPRTGTTVYDRSGNGRNGTAVNGPVWGFTNSGIYDFDGTDDYISFGSSTLQYVYTDPFSLEIWVNPDTLSGFKHLIGVTYASYRLAHSSGTISFRLDANTINTGGGTLTVGEWTHVVATWDPTTQTAKVYKNGSQITSATNTNCDWTHTGTDFRIASSPGENYYFDGKVSNAKVYSKTLSPSEVLENYKSTRSRFGTDGIVTSNLSLHLDAGNVNSFDNSGNTIYDLSGGGNNGTLTNGPVFKNRNGGTISFDGADDVITVPMANLRPTSAITEECWVYIENNTVQVFIGSQYGTSSNNSYAIWLTSTDVLAAGVNIGGSFNYQTKAYTISTNKWYHLAHTYDGTTQRIYANGIQIHSWATSGAITYNTNNTLLAVGNDWNGSGYNVGPGLAVEGNLSITRIYSTALSAAQILQNYNAERNRFGLD